MKLLVDEYFVEGDIDEALDCVRDLDAPHFGHEVVKKIVYEAVERGDKDKSLRSVSVCRYVCLYVCRYVCVFRCVSI